MIASIRLVLAIATLMAIVTHGSASNGFSRGLRISAPRIDQTVSRPVVGIVRSARNAVGNLSDYSPDSKTTQCLIPVTDIDANSVQPDIYFFTSSNSDNNREYNYDQMFKYNASEQQLSQSKFNPKWATYFFVHGFMASWTDDPWMVETKDLIFNKTKQANVFIIDWSSCSKPLIPGDYPRSVACTHILGDQVGKFVNSLIQATNVKPEHIEFVGHSLGSHISGFVGQNINGDLGRITALDPAGPCFGMISPTSVNMRLSRDDALIVTALHTNANTFGINENVADFDVYINGGDSQPGCPSLKQSFAELITLQLVTFVKDFSLTCSHSYSHDLITPDLGQCQSVAYRCSSYRLFRLGECGQCNQDNDNCHLSTLTIQSDIESDDRFYLAPEELSLVQRHRNQADNCTNNTSDDSQDGDDSSEEFEEYDLVGQQQEANGGNNSDSGQQTAPNRPLENDHNERKEQRYYVRTTSDSPYCLYHYQIIIELKERMTRQNKPIYHVELIKDGDGDGDDDDGNFKSRIVQVKHLVSSCFRKENLLGDHDDAMTALITFTNADETSTDEQTLASPTKFQQIRLFTDDKSQLNKVKQIKINYMSNMDYDMRQSLSSVYPVHKDQSPRKRKRRSTTWSLASCAQSLLPLSNQNGCSSEQNETYYEISLQAQQTN